VPDQAHNSTPDRQTHETDPHVGSLPQRSPGLHVVPSLKTPTAKTPNDPHPDSHTQTSMGYSHAHPGDSNLTGIVPRRPIQPAISIGRTPPRHWSSLPLLSPCPPLLREAPPYYVPHRPDPGPDQRKSTTPTALTALRRLTHKTIARPDDRLSGCWRDHNFRFELHGATDPRQIPRNLRTPTNAHPRYRNAHGLQPPHWLIARPPHPDSRPPSLRPKSPRAPAG